MSEQFVGLTEEQVKNLRQKFGVNALEERKKGILAKFLAWLVSPISLMLLAAAILSFISGSTADGWIIVVLFLSNFGIQLWHENKADRATEALQKHLTVIVKVLRGAAWKTLPSRELVPGDIVQLNVGSVVPADVAFLAVKNVTVNQSQLTGESLPVGKDVSDTAYSGSFLSTGSATARVTATGSRTYFGKTLKSADSIKKRSILEKDILSISRFLSYVSIAAIIILTTIFLAEHDNILELATLDLSLLIAGIPVALPTVMSLIMSIGVLELARKQAVVRRLSSLEDLANVDLLLSDKTGTLTENKIEVEKLIPLRGLAEPALLRFALCAAPPSEDNPIDNAVRERGVRDHADGYPLTDFVPGDSDRKHSTSYVTLDGKPAVVSFGAPGVIRGLCAFREGEADEYDRIVRDAASRGYRALSVALLRDGKEEKHMEPLGFLLLADQIRSDASDTIHFLEGRGVAVKMLTGDSYEVGETVSKELGLPGNLVRRAVFDDPKTLSEKFEAAGGFAEVLPSDKLLAVKEGRKNHVVAVTGDGVNDVPPVKAADVGVAVKNSVDALRGTADMVLLTNGIGIIKNAIVEARRVFMRLYNYSVYRISESFRLIITIAVIGVLYRVYPMTPVQIIVLAFLNDVPIVTLAFDRVKIAMRPAHINVRSRFIMSTLFGAVGIVNGLCMVFVAVALLHLPWPMVQTMFFLLLTVSGHMLIYVAHTNERWYKFLPSWQVIVATIATQLVATAMTFFGVFTAAIPAGLILFVWIWSFLWMQVTEFAKWIRLSYLARQHSAPSAAPASA